MDVVVDYSIKSKFLNQLCLFHKLIYMLEVVTGAREVDICSQSKIYCCA